MKQLLPLTILVLLLTNFAFAQDYERKETSQTKQLPTIKAVVPVFSPAAQATNTSGKVIIEVTVNKDGSVTSAKAVEGHPLLRRSAETAARMWKFESAEKDNTIKLTFVFSILQKSASAEELASVFTIPYQVEVKIRPFEPIIHSDPVSDRNKQKRKIN